jgi:hypothetical protein
VARKRGRLSPDEKEQIQANAATMSVDDIATLLNRSPEVVADFIGQHVNKRPGALAAAAEKATIRQELRDSAAWKNLKDEFTPDELRYFEEMYVSLMGQFKGDVLPSEETQIFQAVKFELLMSRNLKERKRAREDIDRLEQMQAEFLKQFNGTPGMMTDDQREAVLAMETQINVAKAAEQSRTNEYVKLQERHEALMKSLKSTRDQRVKQIESAKVNFLGVIKMLQDRDVQQREGRQMELMKLAGQREGIRLGRPHTFEDGNEDSPILSSDTVDLGPEGSEQEVEE